jgi:hypothetical protein
MSNFEMVFKDVKKLRAFTKPKFYIIDILRKLLEEVRPALHPTF